MKSEQGGVRNIGILAHIDAGKTSLTERILYLAGRLRSPGEVDSGTTATDYLEVERERGITVKAACVRLDWASARINLIDTPGHVDFGGEVERSLRVLDGAVLVLCGVAGVQSRTEGILAGMKTRSLAALAFINKLDRRGASFGRVLAELAALRPEALALQYALGEGGEWEGLVDLLSLRVIPARDGGGDGDGAASEAGPGPEIPAEALEARRRLVERLAEIDDTVMEAYVAGTEPGEAELARAIRKGTIEGRILPVLAGSAFSDGSVAALLDAVAAWLPTPAERGCPEGLSPADGKPLRRLPDPAEPFSGFVFKTQSDARNGRLSWLRIWSGRVLPGDRLVEASGRKPIRVQRVFAIQADSLEDLPGAEAGDIVALALAPAAGTGTSLCAPSAPVLYERLGFDEPVVSVALEPESRADGEALRLALAALLEDDPSLRASEDADTGRVSLAGMGELHLEVAVERLRKERGVRLRAGRPQVSCREALKGTAESVLDFDRDMNGERVRGQLALRLAPRGRGEGRLVSAGPGLRLPPAHFEALRRGVEASASVGPSSAWPVEDFEATILAVQGPSSARQAELALEMAASMATRECLGKAGTLVLEPWMRLEISLPGDCLGPAMAALSGRGGRVEAVEEPAGAEGEGGLKEITAAAPMRLLFGFASELRSATAGKASWQARFLRFEPERGAR